MDDVKLLTDKEVAERLQIPFDAGHIARLRSRDKLPHVLFDVGGEKYYRYPPDELATWIKDRLRVGNRLINRNRAKPPYS